MIKKITAPLHAIYTWTLELASHKYAVIFLAIVAFTESSFFLVPPDVLLIVMCLSKPNKAFYYALITTIFSVLGGIFGYAIGYFLFESIGYKIINFYQAEQAFETIKIWYNEYGFLSVFIAGFTPIPYKIATISSGVFAMNIPAFILSSILSRGLRFFIVALMLWYFGDTAKKFIEKYFGLLTILFTILFIIGIYILTY